MLHVAVLHVSKRQNSGGSHLLMLFAYHVETPNMNVFLLLLVLPTDPSENVSFHGALKHCVYLQTIPD